MTDETTESLARLVERQGEKIKELSKSLTEKDDIIAAQLRQLDIWHPRAEKAEAERDEAKRLLAEREDHLRSAAGYADALRAEKDSLAAKLAAEEGWIEEAKRLQGVEALYQEQYARAEDLEKKLAAVTATANEMLFLLKRGGVPVASKERLVLLEAALSSPLPAKERCETVLSDGHQCLMEKGHGTVHKWCTRDALLVEMYGPLSDALFLPAKECAGCKEKDEALRTLIEKCVPALRRDRREPDKTLCNAESVFNIAVRARSSAPEPKPKHYLEAKCMHNGQCSCATPKAEEPKHDDDCQSLKPIHEDGPCNCKPAPSGEPCLDHPCNHCGECFACKAKNCRPAEAPAPKSCELCADSMDQCGQPNRVPACCWDDSSTTKPCPKCAEPEKPKDEQWDNETGECTHGLIGNYFTCNGSPTGCERERFKHCCYHLKKEWKP